MSERSVAGSCDPHTFGFVENNQGVLFGLGYVYAFFFTAANAVQIFWRTGAEGFREAGTWKLCPKPGEKIANRSRTSDLFKQILCLFVRFLQ